MENLKAVCEKFRSHLQNITITFIVIFALFFHLDLVSSKCGGPGSSFFETHPNDVSIVEGGNAVFVCTVMRFDPDTETLSWHVFPDKYHTVILDFYDEPSQNKTSVITVYDVGRNEQTFKCILRGLYHGFVFETCYSQVSTMHVQYFPRGNEITCGPKKPLGELYDESLLAVWCMVQEGNPSVHLSWETEGMNLSFTELHLEVEGKRLILNHKLYISPYLHLKTLYCVASSDARNRIFLDEEITCSIGPLLVRHEPQVKICSSEMLDAVDINARKIELNCTATSYPEKKFYNWLCSPEDTLIGCHNVTSETILLGTKDNNTSITDIYFEVSCSVTNAEGTTTDVFSSSPNNYRETNGSSVMDTTPAGSEINGIGLCQSITPRLNLINKSVNWEMFSFEVHMVCFPDCIETAGTNIFISWLVNENKVEPDSNGILHSFSTPTSSVTAKGDFKEYDIINVTCEIRTHNVTYRKSVNISFGKPPYVSAHINKQLVAHPLSIEASENKSQFIGQPEMATSALHTEIGQTEIQQGNGFKLSGVQVIIFTTIAVLVCLLLTACICAFCTVCLFKYLQQANSFDINEQKSSRDCVSFHVSQQNSCLDQSIMSISNEDAMYEKPVTPLPSPPLASPNVAYKYNHVREGVHFFEKGSSRSLSVIYDCTNSITSSICSNTSTDISVPSGYSEWSEQMPSELQEDVGNITCISTEHVYDNAGIIRMHMFPRSASLNRLPRQNDLNETEFPPPAFPGSGAQDSSRL